ncbi:MAG: hypothetical protein GKR96_14370 [Gammaproteobacteria bacterium]|nr:hypothetical protein [Gammaproteobacteria bacterium]
MLIYIPVVAALIIKLCLLHRYRGSWTTSGVSKTFLCLLAVQMVASVLEVASLYYGASSTLPAFSVLFLKVYYVTLFWLLAFLLQISMLIVYGELNKKVGLIAYVVATMMTAVMLFTDGIVIGAQSIGYTVTRIPGDYYWAIPVYGVVLSSLAIGVCIYGYRVLENHFERLRCMYLLVAVCSLTAPILFAVVSMVMGYQTNAAIILPIGITLFLITLGYALSSETLYDIRMWIPFTQAFRLDMARHSEFFLRYDGSEMLAKEKRARHEKRYLIRALAMSDGNQKKAAKRLGISESAISIKRKQYGI